MEIVGIIVSVLGLIVAFFAFKKDHYSKPKDEMEHFIVQFRATQTLSRQVEKDLEDLVTRNNGYASGMWQGITYGDYLLAMKKNYLMK